MNCGANLQETFLRYKSASATEGPGRRRGKFTNQTNQPTFVVHKDQPQRVQDFDFSERLHMQEFRGILSCQRQEKEEQEKRSRRVERRMGAVTVKCGFEVRQKRLVTYIDPRWPFTADRCRSLRRELGKFYPR